MRGMTRSMASIALVALTAVAIALSALALRHRAPTDQPFTDTTTASPSAADGRSGTGSGSDSSASQSLPNAGQARKIAVFGDSVTLGSAQTFEPDRADQKSWMAYADEVGLDIVGGAAVPQGTSEKVAAQAKPVQADLYLAFVGVGDAYSGGSAEGQVRALKELAKAAGVSSPRHFVVAAIGPARGLSTEVLSSWNQALIDAAEANSWTYVDPWQGLRSDTFGWVNAADRSSATVPSAAGARKLAANLGKSLAQIPPG